MGPGLFLGAFAVCSRESSPRSEAPEPLGSLAVSHGEVGREGANLQPKPIGEKKREELVEESNPAPVDMDNIHQYTLGVAPSL